MFDYETYRAQQAGVNPDKGLLVSFEYQSKKINGEYQNIPYVRIWQDKNTEIVRPVSEEDKKRFKDRWEAFQIGEEIPEDGTPINQLPFATPANISACKAERIQTAEQLISVPDNRLIRVGLVNFKYMARDWLMSQKDSNYLEELRGEIESLKKQLAAALEKEVEEPKKRGRPRKNGNATSDD